MSRYVRVGDKLVPRFLYEPPLEYISRICCAKRGTCPNCGGSGVVPEQLDPEQYDELVPCWQCRVWCKPCGKYVKRSGHECVGDKP